MNKSIRSLIFLILFISSCSGFNVERKVENNVFNSSALPAIRIWVNPEIKYIGCVSEKGTSNIGHHYIRTSYLFAKKGKDNAIEQGVLIYLSSLDGGYFLPDLFSGVKNKLSSDIVTVGSQDYQHVVMVHSDIFYKYEVDFLVSKGIIVPNCNIFESFARRDGAKDDNQIRIYYFEPIDMEGKLPCEEYVKSEKDLLENKKSISMDDFLKRSKENWKMITITPQ